MCCCLVECLARRRDGRDTAFHEIVVTKWYLHITMYRQQDVFAGSSRTAGRCDCASR